MKLNRKNLLRAYVAFKNSDVNKLEVYKWFQHAFGDNWCEESENLFEDKKGAPVKIETRKDYILKKYGIPSMNLDELERIALRAVMEFRNCRQKEACNDLGITPRSIHYKLNVKYKIPSHPSGTRSPIYEMEME